MARRPALFRRARPPGRDSLLARGRFGGRRHVVQDPRAAVALDAASSLRRTSLNTCGRRRTWHCVQRAVRASDSAMPLRCLCDVARRAPAPGGDTCAASAAALRGLLLQHLCSSSPRSASSAFFSRRTSACSAFSAASAAFSSPRASPAPPCARAADPRARGRPAPRSAISCCIAWYSLFVLTSISWPLYLLEARLDRREVLLDVAARRLAGRRCAPLTLPTRAVRSASRVSSAATASGISAIRRRTRSAARSSSWSWIRC